MPDNTEADAHKTDDAAQSGGDSAPQNKSGESGGHVETDQAGGRADAPDWFKVEIAKAREKKRNAESEAAELKAEMERLREQLSKAGGSAPESSGSDVPSTPAVDAAKLKEEILADIRKEAERSQAESRLEQEWAKAGEYLRTRPEVVEDPAFRAEVVKSVDTDPALTELAKSNPMMAAEIAYARECARKGIAPTIDSSSSGGLSAAAQSFGPGVSGQAGGGSKREATKADYEAVMADVDFSDPEARAKAKERLKQLG